MCINSLPPVQYNIALYSQYSYLADRINWVNTIQNIVNFQVVIVVDVVVSGCLE